MTQPENIGNEGTDTSQSQEEAKTFTQADVDNMMARAKGAWEKKFTRQYADLGDIDELREIKSAYEQKKQQEQIEKGEFQKTLQELASKKDAEIQKRDAIIKEYKVNTPLLNAAAKYKSVNPQQVQSLLTSKVRLNDNGDVEVIDANNAVRYNDSGDCFNVDDLVKEFLDNNPHFVQASPSTTNTKSNSGLTVDEKFDLASLDLTNPEHRKKYGEAKAKGLI